MKTEIPYEVKMLYVMVLNNHAKPLEYGENGVGGFVKLKVVSGTIRYYLWRYGDGWWS